MDNGSTSCALQRKCAWVFLVENKPPTVSQTGEEKPLCVIWTHLWFDCLGLNGNTFMQSAQQSQHAGTDQLQTNLLATLQPFIILLYCIDTYTHIDRINGIQEL